MSATSAWRNVVRRREHRERAQPQARAARFGLLEKKKDYKQRAIDYHRKEDTIRKLREKAALKNEDEYYMNMNKAKTKGGIHSVARGNAGQSLGGKTLATLKSQDLAYLQMQRSADLKKIERLKENLHGLVEDDEEEEEEEEEDEEAEEEETMPTKRGSKQQQRKRTRADSDDDDFGQSSSKRSKSSTASSSLQPKHVIFVDDVSDLKSFRPSKYFGTDPSLVSRRFNRLRKEQIEGGKVIINAIDSRSTKQSSSSSVSAAATGASSNPTAAAVAQSRSALTTSSLLAKSDQSLLHSYTEISARLNRTKKVNEALNKLQLEKHLNSKGGRMKQTIRDEKFGDVVGTVYKWKLERKK